MSVPACYAILYMSMAAKARELGYALALHGSLVRDLDLIAVPWTDEAADAEQLVAAMIEACGGFIPSRTSRECLADYATAKPHGRRAWKIYLGGRPYVDLSVMPRDADSTVTVGEANQQVASGRQCSER